MALLPARRSGPLSRPGPQAPARWDPFAGFEDLYQRMGQLPGGALDGGWQEPVQSWAGIRGPGGRRTACQRLRGWPTIAAARAGPGPARHAAPAGGRR
jgi:hypothetical protein